MATEPTAPAAAVDLPLLGHWTFDEPSGTACRDSSGHQYDAAAPHTPAAALTRQPGVFGGAIGFNGQHRLQVAPRCNPESLAKLSFSVWAMPTQLGAYREIFRKEDGDRRILFSFQDNGTHLSLGLNVGGYVECDASLDPHKVLDGQWHHCAATFDGRWMRVYLDGRQIGALERPGSIACGGKAAACIGSSNGGECFQGLLDDLRIYTAALSPEQVATLYRGGADAIWRQAQKNEQALAGLFAPGESFAATLAAARQKLAQRAAPAERALVGALTAKLRAAFPQASQEFVDATGINLVEYLGDAQGDVQQRQADRLVALMLEYRPLTEHQLAAQTPADRQRWAEAEAIAKQLDQLKSAGESARFSPRWVELMSAAGRRIQLRPMVREAVAPYIHPETPPTHDLSADEARETLQRDWLHQADGQPTPQRIRDEIAWTRQLAERLTAASPGRAKLAAPLAELAELDKRAAAITKPDRDLYFQVRQVKRQIMFANPAVDFDRVLFVDMPYPQGSEWRHETRHRLGYMAVPGAPRRVLSGLSPAGKLRQLMPQAPLHGSFWRPDLSYDARRVLFCFKPHNEKAFHLYEVNVDGTDLVQLTDGPYDDLDPIYLPDGHILFSTTRGHTYVRCMPPTNAFVLARCDAGGRDIYLISTNNEPDYLPSVMADGRVIYTRWEYTDKPLWRAAKLWTVNPDGTQVNTFWGNQSVWPDLVKDARSIPGSRRVLCTGSAHHNWFSGSLALVDPDQGYNYPDGLTKITADVPWPETGNGPSDAIESPRYHRSGHYPAYYSPYPLSERDFLVSAQRGEKFLLYLMDVDGNRELIYEGVHNIFHALPLKPRPRPPLIADRVVWPDRQHRDQPQDGVLFSGNVYQNAPAELRDKARYLRVLNIDPKTYTYWNQRPYISTGPVVSAVQSDGVKRILGTVAIEADGSVAFSAPAGMALHFQLLDAEGRALQTMRSFVGLMPGERRGCLGCHEAHSRAPEARPSALAGIADAASAATRTSGDHARVSLAGGQPPCDCSPRPLAEGRPPCDYPPRPLAGEGQGVRAALRTGGRDVSIVTAPSSSAVPLALRKPPQAITPPPWSDNSVSYNRYVQPVLDKYCNSCHGGEGEARKTLDLTQRPAFLMFTEPYLTLIGRPTWGKPYVQPDKPPPGWGIADMLVVEGYGTTDPAGYVTPPPMTRLSYRSRLVELCSSGKHYDVRVDAISRQRLIVWIDAMCPFVGEEEIRAIPDPEFQGVDWLAIRPRIKTAPKIIRPGPVD